MIIAIPSYKRAGDVKTYDFFGDDSVIVIPESQRADYEKYYKPESLVIIPDDRDGSISKKRNAVIEYIDDDEIFMIDDDLQSFIDIDRNKEMTKDEVMGIIKQGFIFLNDSKAKIFGFNYSLDKMRYRPFHPFSLTKPFWQGFGFIKSSIRFDERLGRGEDVDWLLSHINRDRMVWRFNGIGLKMRDKQASQKGGIEAKTESREDIDIILSKWGKDVISYDDTFNITSVNLLVKGI